MKSIRALLIAVVALGPVAALAQERPAAPPRTVAIADELRLVSEGWAYLKAGDLTRAAGRAAEALRASPRSLSAFTLGLEVEIARSTAVTGLEFYERWLGRRTLEEPAALRRIAEAVLREEAAQSQEPAARLEALRGLADDGRQPGAAAATPSAPEEGRAATRARAALGDPQAVSALVADVSGATVDVRAVDALGESGSAQAAGPIAALLGDPRQEVRGAAAAALGKLGTPSVAPQLMPLLNDRSVWVRARAAGALYRLGDDSGLPVLQALAADASPGTKILAAEAMASRPDAAWIALVKDLTSASDVEVRAAAARLIAPHDPALARATLEPLLAHASPAVRELAADALATVVTSDLTLLRHLLRDPSRITRVRAAARILSLTR